MTTTPFLAHNLAVRRTAVEDAKLVTSVGWIGNAAHQAECSDHNPDSTGDVHAIDCMTLVLANQKAIVMWALAHPDDLEYVINQRTIWSRSRGFAAHAYTGTDPHTNHVHISGRHGSSGNVPNVTCTGYDRTAEKITPEGFDIMPTADEVAAAVWNFRIHNAVAPTSSPDGKSSAQAFVTDIHRRTYGLPTADQISAVLDTTKLATALAPLLGANVTEAELAAALVTALKELAAAAPAT